MKTVAEVGYAFSLAATVGVVTYGIGHSDHPVAAEVNRQVMSCANNLGATTKESSTLPAACDDFKDYFGTVSIKSPGDEAATTQFVLPPAREFATNATMDASDIDRQNRNDIATAAALAAFCGLLGFSAVHAPQR